MDARRNPYTPNAGSRPPELAGRDAQLEQFDVLLARREAGDDEQSLVITGLRGVGKTVLLTTFEEMAVERGWQYAFREISPTTEIPKLLPRMVRAMLEDLSPTRKLRAKMTKTFGRLNNFALKSPDGFELAFTASAALDEDDLAEDLTEILAGLGEAAAERGKGVVFLFDEMQFLKPEHFGPLVAALHRCVQKGLPVVYVGAGLPQVPRLAGEARSYAERIFSYVAIGKLDDEAAAAAVVEPARQRGVRFDPAALDRLLQVSGGYPFFIQHYGKFAWLHAKGPEVITRHDVDGASKRALDDLDQGFFQARIQRTTEQERRYMRAMAEIHEDGPYPTGQVAQMLGRATTDLSVVRDALLRKGLIYATPGHYGYVSFTVPHFAGFMRRHQPFRATRAGARRTA